MREPKAWNATPKTIGFKGNFKEDWRRRLEPAFYAGYLLHHVL